jgi:hypothetical protein
MLRKGYLLDDGGQVSGVGKLEVAEPAEHLGVGVHDDLVLEILSFHEPSVAKAPAPAEVPCCRAPCSFPLQGRA